VAGPRVILDAFSRRSWAGRWLTTCAGELVRDALDLATAQGTPTAGLVHHTDHGRQPTSSAFGRRLPAPQTPSPRRAPSLTHSTTRWPKAASRPWSASCPTAPLADRAGPRTAAFDLTEILNNRQRRHPTLATTHPLPTSTTTDQQRPQPNQPVHQSGATPDLLKRG
jgi:transposase InsO family protein